MRVYLGLDVHARQTVYCAQEDSGAVIGEGRVATSGEGLQELLGKVGAEAGTKVGLETGAQAAWISELLSGWGMSPVVVDAAEVRKKSRRPQQKCDRRDAFEICDGLRRGIYRAVVEVPGPEMARLRLVLGRRRHFVRLATSQVNAAKALLRSVGLGSCAESLTTGAAWEKLVRRPEVSGRKAELEMHREVWQVAKAQEAKLDQALAEALTPLREIHERLMTVPGVGRITAASYLAALVRPERFEESGQVVSYLGLAPSSWNTGEQVRQGHISKRGNVEARAMLVEAAQHAAKPRHPLNPYFRKLYARKGYKRAIVGVAQRLARILWRMWLNREEFDLGKLNVVAEKQQTTRTYYYRLKNEREQGLSA